MSDEVTQILVGNSFVRIIGISEILRSVQELNLKEEEVIKSKILELAKKSNYIHQG